MTETNILITGLGVISAAGNDVAGTLSSFARGERHAGPVTLFPTTLTSPVFEVKQLPEGYHLDGWRTLSLARIVVDQALREAGLHSLKGLRVGVCLGTTVASQLNDLPFYRSYRDNGSAEMTAIDRYLKGNLAEYIARKIGARGPQLTVANACSSGTDAIGTALSWLKSGVCDMVIAGGADELSHVPYCGFAALGVANPELCAPFDRDRKGLNLGEGAGVLLLETAASAKRRGVATDLALLGYGAANDSYHLTAPAPDGVGLKAALRAAMAEGCVGPEDIAFINAHGTGTTDNDLVEGKTFGELFGPGLTMLSTKGYSGHTLGAAGGIEAVFAALGLREGWIPASAGFSNRDENMPLEPVRKKTTISGRYALSTSLAFGGNNAAILIGRREER
jgi:3-oxoacyl-[acyl-carrier-protein] synthase II